MKVSMEMYTKLFNAVTDATCMLEEASKLLRDAQLKVEDIYINLDNDDKE